MSRKNVIVPYKLINAQSLGASFQSDPVQIQWQDNVGVQIVTSGITDNTGQFSIQVTIDDVTWQDVTLSPVIPALDNSDDTIFCNLNQLPFKAFRIAFVAAGGTPDGTVNAHIMAKALS